MRFNYNLHNLHKVSLVIGKNYISVIDLYILYPQETEKGIHDNGSSYDRNMKLVVANYNVFKFNCIKWKKSS